MNKEEDKLKFSWGKEAIKQLGKSLYSNPISAISELVANSLDAKSTEIKIIIDLLDKQNSVIFILDNGFGMDLNNLKNNYCKLGFNKRKTNNDEYDKNSVMGRKGIGKLAALYLSDAYSIFSKKENSNWNFFELDLNKTDNNDSDDQPELEWIPEDKQRDILQKIKKYDGKFEFDNYKSGTFIFIDKINLKGYGKEKIQNLAKELSDYFLNQENQNSIFIKIIFSNNDLKKDFVKIQKNFSYKNMLKILYLDLPNTFFKKNKKLIQNNSINISVSNVDDRLSYSKTFKTEIATMNDLEETKIMEIIPEEIFNVYKKTKPFLKGWIAVYDSLKGNEIRNEIRLYIRGKLAVKNILPILNNTQVFSKYIEGEIQFDLLDINELEDITTSNRQDIDVSDERFKLLIKHIEKYVNELVTYRLSIKEKVDKDNKQKFKEQQEKSKKNILKEAEKRNLNPETITLLEDYLKSNTEVLFQKDDPLIFISHKSFNSDEKNNSNSRISRFVYESLIELGVETNEIFYSSDSSNPLSIAVQKDFIEKVKDFIRRKNTKMLYIASNEFIDSKWCCFESGAGWVTKTKNDVSLITDNINSVKLNLEILEQNNDLRWIYGSKQDNSSGETAFVFDNLNEKESYQNFINILNDCFDHINECRKLTNKEKIQKINFNNNLIKEKILNIWKSCVFKCQFDDCPFREKELTKEFVLPNGKKRIIFDKCPNCE